MEVMQRHFPLAEGSLILSESAALRAPVMEALRRHSWVHFACHGLHHPASPASSAFVLWDGPLTVADLGSVRPVDPPELAFLSACETASAAGLLPEESIHLAAAMQLLGYRHVVATLWAIHDAPAPAVADVVYGALRVRDGASPMDPDRAAYAVREAVLQLRAQHPDHPLVWAPYVHLGP
jgi:CHAT domain-containing protein